MSVNKIVEEIRKFLKETTVKYDEYSSAYGVRSNKNRVQQKGSKPPLGSSDPFLMPATKKARIKRKKKRKARTRVRVREKGEDN